MSSAPPIRNLTDAELVTRSYGARVLVLSAKFGGGHKSTADALGQWFARLAPVLAYYRPLV